MTQLSFADVPGVLYCDDNLVRLRQFENESVDLIYLDPPFFRSGAYQVIWGDEGEVRSFKNLLQGGINHYVGWMKERVLELKRVLKPTGSIYLHCDPAASHYLKVMLDGVFGHDQFRNEIIWKRTGAHSGAKGFGPVHDTILFYSRTDKFQWHPQRGTYDPKYVQSKFTMEDPDGRRYQPISLTPSGTRNGETGKPWRGIDPTAKGYHWKYPPSRLEELDAQGLIYWPRKSGGMPRLKFYLDEAPGMLLQDVWSDIPPVNARARERLGYPTQKPEALLERIVLASSTKGDVVLDPFCGCGTTIAVAHRQGRKWIGIDISLTATEVIKRRMEQREGIFRLDIIGTPKTADDLRTLEPLEFQNWVIRRIHGTHAVRMTGDLGIDGYSFFERLPVQVKQMDRVGRNAVDNFETAVRRDKHHKGYIIAFGFTRGAYEEVARVKSEGLEIELVEISSLLGDPTTPLRDASQLLQDLRRGIQVALTSTTVPETPTRTALELAGVNGPAQ